MTSTRCPVGIVQPLPQLSFLVAEVTASEICGFDKLMWGSDYPRTIVEITYKKVLTLTRATMFDSGLHIFFDFYRHFKAYYFRKGNFNNIGNDKRNYTGGKHRKNAHSLALPEK